MFAKFCHFYAFFCFSSCTITRFVLYFVWLLKFSGCQCESSILYYVFLYNSQKNSLENITTKLCQNQDFFLSHSHPIFRIFKQNWEDPNENRVVGQSASFQFFQLPLNWPVLSTFVCFCGPFFHLMFHKTVYIKNEHQNHLQMLNVFFHAL